MKQYTYITSDIIYSIKFNEDLNKKSPVDSINNMQCSKVFENVEEVIDDFLNTYDYDKEKDGDLFFQKTIDQDSGKEIAMICFNKLMLSNGRRPSSMDMFKYQYEDAIFYKHIVSMVIYEFNYKPLSLRMIKLNADINKYC